jgi:hypothetical protein
MTLRARSYVPMVVVASRYCLLSSILSSGSKMAPKAVVQHPLSWRRVRYLGKGAQESRLSN